MAVAYPGPLPLLQFARINYTRGDSVIRSNTDAGPAKTRARYSHVPREYQQTVVFTETQQIIMDSFYYTTLIGGSLPFDHPEPINGGTVELRFLGPIAWRMVAHHSNPDRALWEGSVAYEVLG